MLKQEQNTSYKSKSKPESRSRLGFFIFITVLVTSLVVGGTIYAWQKKELNSLRKRKTERIEELESQVNELNTKIYNLKEASETETIFDSNSDLISGTGKVRTCEWSGGYDCSNFVGGTGKCYQIKTERGWEIVKYSKVGDLKE